MKRFNEWLQDELRKREFSQADLATRSGLAPSTISRILSGQTRPSDDAYLGIAKALGEPPEKIFRVAGRLPPEPNSAEQDLLYSFRLLSPPQQRLIIDMLRGLQGQPAGEVTNAYDQPLNIPPIPTVPEDEHIMELFQLLDMYGKQQVYAFTRWILKGQLYSLNSSGQLSEAKKREWQKAIEHIDLLLAIDEADPQVVRRIIGRLQEMLQAKQEREKIQ